MKKIIIILDGLSDRPCPELDNKTPLEAADAPNLDFLAKEGKTGIMYPIEKGWAPESDQSMIAMLGNDPFKVYTGRGVLEAYGSGVDFKGQTVCRCNFSEIKDDEIINIQGANEKETEEYARLLNQRFSNIRIVPTIGYRAVMLIKSKASPKVTNTHPGYKIVKNYTSQALPVKGHVMKVQKCKPLENKAKETADIINRVIDDSKRILKNKVLLTRGTGNKLPKLKKLKGKWALLADMPVEKAIGQLVGMMVLSKYEDLKETFSIIKENFKKFDAFYLQIKGPDSFGHKGDPFGKRNSISKIDHEFISKIVTLPFDVICVTADHSTPCSIRAHSEDPTPILVYGKGKDDVEEFSEKACQKGSIGEITGRDLLKVI